MVLRTNLSTAILNFYIMESKRRKVSFKCGLHTKYTYIYSYAEITDI